ncbi:uncharacterized protein stbd1 isoform X2 [Thalassophryne amazonica]|uniref:uncharacterized protein stbd1 isoform X2 n=1 Tax=Thalassophryne amazonica TaxID=390379 RepID=UPI001472018B|nr:uncharacterized protein stbd1 isoform X2 [Thalassophryne amazonica]
MTLKNGSVSLEKRLDLASLFCMISRHGPAVAVVVIAMVSVVAAFLIYRNVRSKRRKAKAADGASCAAQESAEEPLKSAETAGNSAPSTGVIDASEDVELKVRRRRAAASKCPLPPQGNIQDPDLSPLQSREQTTLPDTGEVVVSRVEDVGQRHASSKEEIDGGNQGVKDVTENQESVSERHQEADKVLEAPGSSFVFETNLQCATISVLKQTHSLNYDGQQDEATMERNLDKPVLHVEDLSISYSQSDSVETDYLPESKADTGYCSHEGFTPEADDELVDDQRNKVKIEILEPYPVEDLTVEMLQQYEEICVLSVAQQINAKFLMTACANTPDQWSNQSTQGDSLDDVLEDAHLDATDDYETVSVAESHHTILAPSVPLDVTDVAAGHDAELLAEQSSSPDLLFICEDQQSADLLQKQPVDVMTVTSVCAIGSYRDGPPEEMSHPDASSANAFDLSVAIVECDDAAPVMDNDYDVGRQEEAEDDYDVGRQEEAEDDYDVGRQEEAEDDYDVGRQEEAEDDYDVGRQEEAEDDYDVGRQEEAEDDYDVGRQEEAEDDYDVGRQEDVVVILSRGFDTSVVTPGSEWQDASCPHSQQVKAQSSRADDWSKSDVPVQSHFYQVSHYEDFAKNEDFFGHEVEDTYNRALDQSECDDATPVMDDDYVGQQEQVEDMVVILSRGFDTSVVTPGSEWQDASCPCSQQAEAQSSCVDDLRKSDVPTRSHFYQVSHYEDFAKNEDFFGHVVEDTYNRALDQFALHITTNIMSLNMPKPSSACEAAEVVSYKNTEISIMEATMDTNEWITDGSSQILPWMKVSVTESLRKTEHQHKSPETPKNVPPSCQALHGYVNVTFRIHYITYSPFQMLAVTGNQPELGSWQDSILLEPIADGYWVGTVSLPAEKCVEYKFVVVDKGEICRWEECSNRFLDTACGDNLLVHKWWGFL